MRPVRPALLVGAFWLAATCAPSAQQARTSALAVDTAISADSSVDGAGRQTTGVQLDAVASLDLGHGMQAVTRSSLQRIAATSEWNAQIWVAALRYERSGPVRLRVEAGYVPSPIGLANLRLRPHLNPTIGLPASLFTALPAQEPRGPRTNLLGSIYPLGATVAASGRHWDARAGLIDSSPLRVRRVFADQAPPNPPRFATVVAGAGVTPVVGLRVGASFARGGWTRAGESSAIMADRQVTVTTVESEFAVRHTLLLGEWTRDAIDTSAGTRIASGWFIEGQQTVTPRWFLAGRVERMRAQAALATGPVTQHFTSAETTLGYRLSRGLTLRASHRAREVFARPGFDHSAAVSIVWWRRWW